MAEGFIDNKGVFRSFDDRIVIAVISVIGPGPHTGVDVEINPIAYNNPVCRKRLPIDLRKIATQIENYNPREEG